MAEIMSSLIFYLRYLGVNMCNQLGRRFLRVALKGGNKTKSASTDRREGQANCGRGVCE